MKMRCVILFSFFFLASNAQDKTLLPKLKSHVDYFNSIDTEIVVNHVSNKQAYAWMADNIPLFECPDTTIENIYYYRWWAIRKHLKRTLDGYVFTEFITPVNHAGKYNTVSSGLGHHINELRWLRDPQYLNQYMDFWIHVVPALPKNHLYNFSSWLQHSVYERYLVDQDTARLRFAFPMLHTNYQWWEKEKQVPSGLFWQFDVKDAMEESISGSRKEKNRRPTINSYMYGNAVAMSRMASLLGENALGDAYKQKSSQLKKLVHDSLWDAGEQFFKVLHTNAQLEDAREAIGFIPWYFNLPNDKVVFARQWDQLLDTNGFRAPWGITTAERRHPGFRTHGSGHGCEWDGAVWPFATTQTLKGLSNLLKNYKHHGKMNAIVFYDALHKYAWSHQKSGLPYLGEYQDEKNGYWLKGDNPRSSYYNHSGFADLIINDLIGLRTREDDVLEIHPLITGDKWKWFKLSGIAYHGKIVDLQWDQTGARYGEAGFKVIQDGKLLYKGIALKPIKVRMKS
jgi:hypothetical protein